MTDYAALYETTRARLSEGTATNPIRVSVSSRNEGGFKSRVAIRDFELVIDQPKGFGGGNEGPKPSEVLLAALASCQEITYRLYAAALGIQLDGVRVELVGTQDLRGFLGVDPQTPAGFAKIEGTVHIDTPADEAAVARLQAMVDRHCPVLDDLRRPVEVSLTAKKDQAAS